MQKDQGSYYSLFFVINRKEWKERKESIKDENIKKNLSCLGKYKIHMIHEIISLNINKRDMFDQTFLNEWVNPR
jgi:hypothetical protein